MKSKPSITLQWSASSSFQFNKYYINKLHIITLCSLLLLMSSNLKGQCPAFGSYGPYSADESVKTLTTTPLITSPHISNAMFTGTGIINSSTGMFDPGLATVGPNTITLMADTSGMNCPATMVVINVCDITLNCLPDFSIDLDSMCNATITEDMLSSIISVNPPCSITSSIVSPMMVGFGDIGNTIPVTLTVTSNLGQVKECVVMVTVNPPPCPSAGNILLTIGGIMSTAQIPDTICTNAGLLTLNAKAVDNFGAAICMGEGTFSNTSNGASVHDSIDNKGSFDPLLAGPGMHIISFDYICPGSGQMVASSLTVTVVPTPVAELLPDTTLQCLPDSGAIYLSTFFADISSQTGKWKYVSGPPGSSSFINDTSNSVFYNYEMDGCYEFSFMAADTNECLFPMIAMDTIAVHIQTSPVFDFKISSYDQCMGNGITQQVSLDITNDTPGEVTSGYVIFETANPADSTYTPITDVSAPVLINSIDSGTTADYTICVIGLKTMSASCGLPQDSICETKKCIEFSVYNDGFDCNSSCEENPVDICAIEVDPQLTLSCSFFTLMVPFDLVGANITPRSKLIGCEDTSVVVSYNIIIGGFNPTAGAGGATIGSLPGISIICDVLNFCICIDLGFLGDITFRPFKKLYDALGCGDTIAEVILRLLGAILGGDGGGAIVVADTDGDGAFDFEVGSDLSGDDIDVPVNIDGNGELTVRIVTAWPNSPAGVCGTATTPGQDLLTLLPIGAIPLVGPQIVALLNAASCNVDLSWSNEKTVVYQVINSEKPVFINCQTDGYTFSEDFSCDTEANWSIPIAVDGCSGKVLPFFDGVPPSTGGVRKISGPDPGDDLPIGLDTVMYEAISCNGKADTCIIPIIIDAGDPQLIAPGDFTVCTDIDRCDAIVLGLAPLRGIGCNTVISYYTTGATIIGLEASQIIGEPSGSTFKLDTTTIYYKMTWQNAFGITFMEFDTMTLIVNDCQFPVAECHSVTAQLDNNGFVTVTAQQIDALSSDNCTPAGDLNLMISDGEGMFFPTLQYNCDSIGINFVTLRVTDEAGNSSYCLATVDVVDFFDGFTLTMDLPELCLEANNPEQLNFSNYLKITQPNGTIITSDEVSDTLGGNVVGLFGITSFIPTDGIVGVQIGTSAADPADIGYIDEETGQYTPGSSTGYVTISYVMTIVGPASQDNNILNRCHIVVHETFELNQPLTMGDPMCECIGVNSRQVDLGIVEGGLEPYRLVYSGGTLDHNSDGFPDDTLGIYTYDVANGYDINDGEQDLGLMWLNFTSPIWQITVIDARGCEISRSGSCDIIDLTEGPEIDCMGTNDFDTEVYICERQYSWLHAIPTDNCAVTQYSYRIINPDGTIAGPFTLDALIDDANTGVPLDELLEAEYEFENGTSVVSYYAEDAVGNFTTCSFNIIVEDNDPPYFINCPYPDVIAATETDHCDAFVNFALPLAEDNCVFPTVTQIDDTGFKTGDRFPIGTTILTFQALDAVGNKAICQVKVIVNNYWEVPTITCPANVTQINDDWLCGAVVNNIGALAEELCTDELIKTYQIVLDDEVVSTGLDDASGTYFEVGTSTVTYRAQNQPLLLISEITQDGDALIGGMNPPLIVNEFQCFSDTLFALGNGDTGEGLVFYPVDEIIYHYSGATDGNEYFEEIYFPGKCVQPNHVASDTHGPDPADQIIGMVWDPIVMKFIAMDINGNIFTVSTTGDYLQISTYDQAFPLAGYAIVGTSYYGVDQASNNLYEFIPGTGTTVGAAIPMTSSGDAIATAIDIVTDPLSGDVYIIYNTAASATAYIGTLNVATGAIDELGDTFIDFAGITIDETGQVYGVSSKAAGSDLFTIKCAIPGDDYIEITNFGPATYDISCLIIDRTLLSGDIESYTVPAGVVLAPGEIMVLHYGPGVDNLNAPSYFLNYCEASDQPANAAIPYSIYYGNNMIDAMTMFTDAQGGIIREDLFDTNTPADFVLAEDCLSITLGEYNPIYPDPIDNGTSTSLQTEPAGVAECSFTVTIEDGEAPMCMEIDDMNLYTGPALNAVEGECNQSIITVPEADECILTEINVSITGNIVGAEYVTVSLISPQNDTLVLYDKLCAGDAAVDITFDDESENSASAICGTWTGDFRPQTEMLMKFYTSKLAGDWILFVNVEEGNGASFNISSWTIESTCMMDWEMDDVVLENDPSLCSAEFTWIHPYFVDNCTFGTIRVDYLSDEDIDLPTGGILLENFRKGGYEVTETFSVGVTTVQYTLTDIAGNVSQCSFTVTVLDTEFPVLTYCPNDIYVGLEGGECEERVFFDITATDNCGIESIIGFPPSGSYFPIGINPVVVEVTDVNGNVTLCEFNIIVLEYVPESNQLNCNNAINLSLDENCEAVILADQILEGNEYGCYDDYCITLTTETGIPHDNYFDVNDINQTFIVTIIDCNTDSTNSCWGTVTIEEKFTPEIQCPIDVTIACNQDPDKRDEFGVLLTGEAYLLNCEPGAEIIYEDNAIDFGQCAIPRMEIQRIWIVTDADGNQDACTQLITIDAINLDSIVFPVDLDLENALECFDVNLDPSLTDPDSTGHPTINGYLVSASGSLCMISMNMEDDIFDICPGSYEILRTWKIRNMCLPISPTNPIQHTQIIKVLDTTPPKMVDCPSDMILSVDPWGCQGSSNLPIPQNIYDQCSDVVFSAAVYGGGRLEITGTPQDENLQVFAYNLRIGDHRIVYRTKDDCGNTRECEFNIHVVDNTPPTAIAIQNIVLSITSAGTGDDGVGKLYVESLDNGSFDGCGPVKLEIRRDTDSCDFRGNNTYNADGHPQDGSPNPNSPNYDPDEGAYVKFCCEDLYNTDLDVNDDGVNDVGYVKVWLRVWDDGDRDGIFGTSGDSYNEAWAYVKVEDKLAPVITCPPDITITCADDTEDLNVTGEAIAYGTCGSAPIEFNDIITNLSTCKEGFIRRRWSIVGRMDVFCDQTITLEAIDAQVSVSFAQVGDTEVSGCPDQISLGEPTWIAGPCDVMGYTLETDTFFFEDGACYKMVNVYTVINWCDYDPNNPFWVETDDFTDGLVRHTQIVKVTDDTKPVLDNCDDQMFAINDHSDIDDDGIVCEAKIVLTNSATDPGSTHCPTGWLKWQVFVDLWSDGTDDLEFSSYLPPFDTQFNDTNGNGIPDRYVAPTSNGEEISIALPDIEGSMSNHKVRWIVSDGCQNVASCDYEFMVVDKKAPTPYCLDISTAVMENDGTVSIWASDFNIGSFDNCTAEVNLRYTFSNVDPADDPAYDGTRMSSSRTFDCDDVENSPVEVNMYVWDEKGNADFCIVYLTVIDNNGTCGEGSVIAGRIATEEDLTVVGVGVSLMANLPEYPRVSPTDENGIYTFLGVPHNADYEISSSLDIDYTNGVSTIDLVYIQRHLLGIEEFTSPYKVIAADVNGDEKIKASDLLILRKLILGIVVDIPNNESWRFVDKNQVFDNIYSPWPFDEELEIDVLEADKLDNDYVAIKVGDVNGNAVTNLKNGSISTTRDLRSIKFNLDEAYVQKGQTVDLTFEAGENIQLNGYQFSIELDGLVFEDISGHSISLGIENVGLISEDLMTMSYHVADILNLFKGSDLFSIKFVADKSGRLSDMIQISSKLTSNEAYVTKDLSLREVELIFENEMAIPLANKLYQNEPNPFRKLTSIGFDLTVNSDVTLTIMSATGSVVTSINLEGKEGHNTYELDANLIGMNGLYYYKLESEGFMDTKKMILVK